MTTRQNALDRALGVIAPRWALKRLQARLTANVLARHYEAAQATRRTEHWKIATTDPNSAVGKDARTLRFLARDLVRNHWAARRGKQVIAANTVGWGIVPKPESVGVRAFDRARKLWKQWAETSECDAGGQLDFYGLERVIIGTVAESGEALVRRYRRPLTDRLAIPLQLQVLEPDHLDVYKDGMRTAGGGKIVQGVEFDSRGRRAAYWLFTEHPGSSSLTSRLTVESQRVPAEDILHIYDIERANQARGVTWYAAVISRLKEFDEYEDATLLRQKIAACFAGFISDAEGLGTSIGEVSATDPLVETIEPAMLQKLPPGKTITFGNPPTVGDYEPFTDRVLHAVASGLGVTYEDLTGDYSQVNFSSARMARLAHWSNVYTWRWQMLIPMFCTPAWRWAMEAAVIAGTINEIPAVGWTAPPMPMIAPEKEGLALQRMVRTGGMTFDEMLLELGKDPETHWAEYAAQLKRLDELGIVLDSDARRTTQAGNATPAAPPAAPDGDVEIDEDEPAAGRGRRFGGRSVAVSAAGVVPMAAGGGGVRW